MPSVTLLRGGLGDMDIQSANQVFTGLREPQAGTAAPAPGVTAEEQARAEASARATGQARADAPAETFTPVESYAVRRGRRAYPTAPRDEWYGDANYQMTGGRMEMMSPDEFLEKAPPLVMDELSRENIDDLKSHIESGRTLDPLRFGADGREDGRHRAHAARELVGS